MHLNGVLFYKFLSFRTPLIFEMKLRTGYCVIVQFEASIRSRRDTWTAYHGRVDGGIATDDIVYKVRISLRKRSKDLEEFLELGQRREFGSRKSIPRVHVLPEFRGWRIFRDPFEDEGQRSLCCFGSLQLGFRTINCRLEFEADFLSERDTTKRQRGEQRRRLCQGGASSQRK